ncbi:MAG: branched-chain amino acid transport system II carrier protein, partial [Selenomonadaceae bacterium]|nr:branched-chain amino acid transport system II carrier protein [Selenomonadaceae bacterium]
YVSLAHLGATSASLLGHSDNGGQLLADAVGIFFGSTGNILLAVIIGLACLTTSCGLASGCSDFFCKTLGQRISYRRIVLAFTFFSFVASNVGLTALIQFSVPFLVAIYPIVIVLVVLSLFDGFIGARKEVYRYAIDFTLVFSILDGLNAAGMDLSMVNSVLNQYIPFYSIMLGWFFPAIAGAFAGWAVSALRVGTGRNSCPRAEEEG